MKLSIRICNRGNGRVTDYSHAQLAYEAKAAARYAKDSDGKVRGWYVQFDDASAPEACAHPCLIVDYLTPEGEARSASVAI